MEDKEYIKELEGMLVFLAKCYTKSKETYFDVHLKTCSIANPDRRDLTEHEQNEVTRFPLVQGTVLQNIVDDISKANKPNPKDIKEAMLRFKNNI